MIIKNISIGTVIDGKWLKHKYKLLELLGKGGIGRVYKAMNLENKGVYAVKITDDIQSITKESDVLKQFQSIESFPRFIEADDCIVDNNKYYYIVMEYIEGQNLNETLRDCGLSDKEILGIGLIIGRTLQILHKEGLVFGDLKLENLMLDKKNKILRIIDLGGVTPIGHCVNEFTQQYDRASWNAGIRKADQQYDLFSLNMLITNLLFKNIVPLKDYDIEKLLNKISEKEMPAKLKTVITCGFRQVILFDHYVYQLENIYNKYEYSAKLYSKTRLNTAINYLMVGSVLGFMALLAVYGEKISNF